MFFGFLLFVAAELAAFVLVADHIGLWRALLVLVLVSASGPFIVRRVGLGVLAHTRERLGRGEAPTAEVLDGLVVLLGGLLLCVPGFIGDVIGLALMVRPVRHFAIRIAGHRIAQRAGNGRGRWFVIDARSNPSGRPAKGTPPVGPNGRLGQTELPPGGRHDEGQG